MPDEPSPPGDRGEATQEFRGNGRDRRDNWFNNTANGPWTVSRVLLIASVVILMVLALILKAQVR